MGASSGAASSGSQSSTSGSSSSFAVLSDLSTMQLVVSLSESEIGNVKVGQTATIAIEALSGRKEAAQVASIAETSTSSSGVVSYEVTFQLDQLSAGIKAGMTATAEVIVKQAEGVNVPTSAISGGSVTVIHDGKTEQRAVVTGLAGDSSTIITSGLKAGEEVSLPVTSTTTSSKTSSALGGTSSKSAASALTGGSGGGFPGGGSGGPPGGVP